MILQWAGYHVMFDIPCDPLAKRERQLSGKPQGVSLITQFFMRVEVPPSLVQE